MARVLLLLLVVSLPIWGSELRGPLYNDPNKIVIQAHLKALSRTDDIIAAQDGHRITVDNSCGYDTAIVEVQDVLVGKYQSKELSAHFALNEFCRSFLQPGVTDYILFLAWNGTVWQIDAQLSSRLLRGPDRQLWIVDPAMIEYLGQIDGPSPKQVRFSSSLLDSLALESAGRLGFHPEPGVRRAVWIKELRSWDPHGKQRWRDNPLYFQQGIPMAAFRQWLGANNSFKPNPLRSSKLPSVFSGGSA